MPAKPKENYALLGDVPAGEAGRQDHLAFASSAKVLARAAIETENPLTIGVFGEWGTGKTSLMHLIKKEMEKEKGAASVWFNAWQYEREEHLIVPLVATINKKLETHKWAEKFRDGAKEIGKALRAIAYGISVKGKIGIPLISEGEVSLSAKDIFDRYRDLNKDTILARSLYFDAFEKLSDCAGKDNMPRVVVFVDDLDRCFPDRAVGLLEHIKLVLHQPGFSFVLGVNDRIIQKFITTKYKKDYNIDIDDSYFEDYLEKIVQVKIQVPKRKPDEMDEYIGNLLDKGKVFPAESKKDMIPLIAEAGKRNPRAIVRLLNRIIVNWRVGKLEKKDYDPLAQLIHEATDEPRYEAFVKALDVTVILEENKEQWTIGEYLADQLAEYKASHSEWTAKLQETKIVSLESEFKKAIRTLDDNVHLWNLLKSDAGRRWLSKKQFRDMMEETSERALEEGKEETPKGNRSLVQGLPDDVIVRSDDIIRELQENMVSIPAGEFEMGSIEHEFERPIHLVKLDGFEIGAVPVTQAQYEAVMEENPSRFKGSDNPVERVSRNDAKEFCEKLSAKTGRNYTLPSESQWEYACRAGSQTQYCFGDDKSELEDYAWYQRNSEGTTRPVGRKRPNDWGLYDMHGNVSEYCSDSWNRSYVGAPVDGSALLIKAVTAPVIRGGDWRDTSQPCRSAARSFRMPRDQCSYVGFRVVTVQAVDQ